MKRLFKKNENMFQENRINKNKFNARNESPLLCGYFICNPFHQIIECSPNFPYFISKNNMNESSIIDMLNNNFLFLNIESKDFYTSDSFTIEDKISKKVFEVKSWKLQQKNTYYFFQEVKAPNVISEITKRSFHHLFDLLPLGIITWNDNKNITYTNAVFDQAQIANKDTLIGTNLYEFLVTLNDDLNNITELMDKIKTLDQKNVVSKCVIKNQRGQEMFIEYYLICDVYEDCNILLFKDETELAQTFEHIRRSDTLNVVGQLAAGIAHEIRNPMTSIKGFIDLIKPELDAKNGMYYEVVTMELERLDLIINEFLFLSKPKSLLFDKHSLIKTIQSTIELMQGQFSLHNIIIEVNYPLNDMFIYCNHNEVKKVMINLLKNAQEVIQENGKIVIEFSSDEKYHSFSIRDNGSGMSEEQLNQIGNAFYTTKEQGTGLGLFVTKKIVEEHGGKLSVESKLGIGTTFTVELPKYIAN